MKTASFPLFDGFQHEEIIPPRLPLQQSLLVFSSPTVLDSVGLHTHTQGHTHRQELMQQTVSERQSQFDSYGVRDGSIITAQPVAVQPTIAIRGAEHTRCSELHVL